MMPRGITTVISEPAEPRGGSDKASSPASDMRTSGHRQRAAAEAAPERRAIIGDRGFRSLCANVARNSSLLRSASRRTVSICLRSARSDVVGKSPRSAVDRRCRHDWLGHTTRQALTAAQRMLATPCDRREPRASRFPRARAAHTRSGAQGRPAGVARGSCRTPAPRAGTQ